MKVSVLGSGRWGTFLGWYANKIGHEVTIFGKGDSDKFIELSRDRKNEYLELPDEIKLSSDLDETVKSSEVIIISISAQGLRGFCQSIKEAPDALNKVYVLCMKGIEASSGKRLTQVFKEEMGANVNVAVWVGPGHVQDFVKGIPNCMLIGSENIDTTKMIVEAFSSKLIRFYYGQDLIGNEIGAATKNVIGIAAGMLDGSNQTSLKGALMARGTREISRLVRAMGGNDMTIYGLSHLGDYEATLFSPYSNNRKFGEDYVLGKKFNKLAEGVATIEAMKKLSEKYDVELPICDALHSIIVEEKDAKEVFTSLFLRPLKFEM